MVKFSIQTVDEVVEILKIGHAFVGLTIASWAGNISGIIYI
jgi:Ca2+/Na+ antiporter